MIMGLQNIWMKGENSKSAKLLNAVLAEWDNVEP
jgi:hypothetical protein